ncbi:putative sucrose utilization protein SUC1 [Cyphellophora attinorum]|uniref:Putative sucrose utilization protein SUC1 n=1 Tax=Cyphellophora attinorum TaxID=1664694 RepID=A0A0N0NJC8_9EURO|nr:putative sucrose utilization protein SUC1 [Phialophora attinorum]KPI36831.1 putative sucrose utilization protein SUC1 [Phialophora attinorum]
MEGTSPDVLHRGVLQTRIPTDSDNKAGQLFTVSELADYVLNQTSGDSIHSADVAIQSPSRPPILSPPIPSGQRSTLTSPRQPSSTPTLSDSHQTQSLFRSSSNASDFSAGLDGASLAVAVGLPVRYGPTILECVEVYFGSLYHVVNVVHEPSFRRLLARPSQLSLVQRCFVLAFCAASILREACKHGEAISDDVKEKGIRFLEQCFTLRASIDFIEEQTPLVVTMSYFLHLSSACLEKVKSSGHFLREAISFGMGLSLHEREQPNNLYDADLICARRTLALLSVTERAMAVLIDVPAILLRTPPSLPSVFFDAEDANTLDAFECLYSLFSLLNPTILGYWSSGRLENEAHRDTLRDMIEGVQHQLASRSLIDRPLPDIPRADILVTQQWLRLILWQISNRLSLLSTLSPDPAFTYNYPIQIAKDLCLVLESLTEDAIAHHHFSIYCKIFEIAYSLMDILNLAGRQKDGPGVHELRVLFGILANTPVTSMWYSKILMERTIAQEPV